VQTHSSAEQNLKTSIYKETTLRINALLEGETDEVAALATVSCELFHAFESFDWVGFYRVTAPELLTVGPYQGGHGCLRIAFDRGVCGAAARLKSTQRVRDVSSVQDHIACSSSTLSEIVIPVFNAQGEVTAVLDVDSNQLDNFDDIDQDALEGICSALSRFYS